MLKVSINCAGPRGCDVARKATWLCHVDARDGLRGTDDVYSCHLIYFILILIYSLGVPRV